MNIMYFNVNHCRNDPIGITNFFNHYKNLVDIFCLQEISANAEQNLDTILKDFHKHHISSKILDLGTINNATYINKKYTDFSFCSINTNISQVAPALLLSTLSGNLKYNILNYHGVYKPGSKIDTAYRIKSSQLIIDHLKDIKDIVICGGDFNLLPDTISINIFEQNNYINLIKKYNIKNTRNKNAWRLFPGNPQYYADYIFTSSNCPIKNFEVIQNTISDHLPLFLSI